MENLIAIIKEGVVDNIMVASDHYAETLPEQTVNVTGQEVSIGYTFSNGTFAAPVKSQEELEAEAREWRDSELSSTDNVAQTPDYPNRDAILVYRQELRDWPSTDAFPETKPVKP